MSDSPAALMLPASCSGMTADLGAPRHRREVPAPHDFQEAHSLGSGLVAENWDNQYVAAQPPPFQATA